MGDLDVPGDTRGPADRRHIDASDLPRGHQTCLKSQVLPAG